MRRVPLHSFHTLLVIEDGDAATGVGVFVFPCRCWPLLFVPRTWYVCPLAHWTWTKVRMSDANSIPLTVVGEAVMEVDLQVSWTN